MMNLHRTTLFTVVVATFASMAAAPSAFAQEQQAPAADPKAPAEAPKPPADAPKPPEGTQPQTGDEKPPPKSLDFELLPPPPPSLHVDDAALQRRRWLLDAHQAVGLGMFGLALANTVVGQLNYSDRFASGPSTGKYQMAHKITAYGTLGAFAASGILAALAPNPLPKSGGFDRVTLHKVSMIVAAGGMAAQAVLGIWTSSREGYLNQPQLATAHLVVGYATFAAITLGVGTIVF
jgi:hypothetical protein